jgi:hypothetical protein
MHFCLRLDSVPQSSVRLSRPPVPYAGGMVALEALCSESVANIVRILLNSCRPTRSVASIAVRSLHASRLVRDEQTSATEQPLSPKLATIVDSISGLTLLEVSELVSALKVSRGMEQNRRLCSAGTP